MIRSAPSIVVRRDRSQAVSVTKEGEGHVLYTCPSPSFTSSDGGSVRKILSLIRKWQSDKPGSVVVRSSV